MFRAIIISSTLLACTSSTINVHKSEGYLMEQSKFITELSQLPPNNYVRILLKLKQSNLTNAEGVFLDAGVSATETIPEHAILIVEGRIAKILPIIKTLNIDGIQFDHVSPTN